MPPAAVAGLPISSLPASTKSKLRSTQILTSLPQLVSELMQNSLDAGAQHIDITIDPEEWECCVRDDGAGISRDGLALLAGGPQPGRYGTSKGHAPTSLEEVATFGFRGEALASVADLCCLEISSRTQDSSETWSIILKGNQTLYAGPSTRWRRVSSGTVVSVRDAFYNLPIRRRSHPNPIRTTELVKKEIECFALVFPNVSFSLEDSRKAKGGIQFKSKRVLAIPKTGSTLAVFRHLYGKALSNHVEEVHESYDGMRVDGFVSLEGAYSKAYHFLYINNHPMETCELHRDIETIFARSSFGKHAYDEQGAISGPRSAARRSPRKTEKKAVYVLNLTIPSRNVDNYVNPAKTAVQLQNPASAAAFLATVVESLLVRHGFLSTHRVCKLSHEDDISSPRKKRRLDFSRNSHSASSTPRLSHCLSHQPISQSRRGGIARHGSAPVVALTSLPTVREAAVLEGSEDVPDIVWVDPTTGETFIIDPRTGNSYPQNAPSAPAGEDPSAAPVARGMRRTLGDRMLPNIAEAPAWIRKALQANEAFKLAEPKIPAVTSSGDPAQRHACLHGHRQPCSGTRTTSKQQLFGSYSWDASQLSRFTREDLLGARVLGQVDRKFVACVVQARSPSDDSVVPQLEGEADEQGHEGAALVLIDQHAADERIRVERFMKEICEGFLSSAASLAMGVQKVQGDGRKCGVRVRAVEPPAPILLTRHEAARIAESSEVREALARWGVIFAGAMAESAEGGPRAFDESSESEAAYVQVSVMAVPEVVAEKLLSGDELRDLIKGFLAKLEADGPEGVVHTSAGQHESRGGFDWQKALRWCPQELVDLINSKACRGAIMFNDTLTLEQCKSLVSRLSDTALPFQCAHGRPSLVPLVNAGGFTGCYGAVSRPVNWKEFMDQRLE